MNLVDMDRLERLRTLKFTVLHRPGGSWDIIEVGRLVNRLRTEASQHPQFPEHIILIGDFAKERTLEALMGDGAYTAVSATGLDDPALPWKPSF